MASTLPTSVCESSSSESGVRIVLLGDTSFNKSELAKLILGCKTLKGQEIGLCTLYKTEETGRKISFVVDTPGWNPISIKQTTENIKTEMDRSVSLCFPGPHVFVLVIPVKHPYKKPSMCEISEAQKHMELLSERVWKHTIVLFDCEEEIEESAINEHKQSAKTILEKCKRSCVFQRGISQISELFMEIDDLVKENNGDFFIPQIYYEKIQPGAQVFVEEEPRPTRGSIEMKRPDLTLRKGNDTDEGKLRQRRGSIEKDRPNLRKENDNVEAAKHRLLDDQTIKPLTVILMCVIGALIGAVAGSEHGALGACAGLVSGIIVGVLLAVLIIYICTYISSYSSSKTT